MTQATVELQGQKCLKQNLVSCNFRNFSFFISWEWWGGKTLTLTNKNTRKTKNTFFRPSRQQQHEATALGLSEATPLASLALTLRKACTTILTTASTKRQLYVKTWTGRTITAVFSPEKVTRIVKKRNRGKDGYPDKNAAACSQRIGLSKGQTIEMTAKLLGGMKHKSLSPKPMDTERKKESIRTVYRRGRPRRRKS